MPWSHVAKLRGVVGLHKDIEACPYEQLQETLAHPKCLVPGEKEQFLQANNDLFCQLQGSFVPLEGIAPQVFEAIYQGQQGEILWVTVQWMIARINECWIGYDIPPALSISNQLWWSWGRSSCGVRGYWTCLMMRLEHLHV